MRPLIGISCHPAFREGTGRPIYCNNRAYVHAVEQAGGTPILIPLLYDLSSLEAIVPRLDGLLLPGGYDIQPSRYGETEHSHLGYTDPDVDALEFALTNMALQEDLPILGICRGMQLINVALGGSLYQDVNVEVPTEQRHIYEDMPRNYIAHRVFVEAGSRMEHVLGTRTVSVNSLHHQAVKEPGQGVLITGRAEDGVAELLEVPMHRFVMATQCHPEEIYKQEPALARLFAAFVRACSGILELEHEQPVLAVEAA